MCINSSNYRIDRLSFLFPAVEQTRTNQKFIFVITNQSALQFSTVNLLIGALKNDTCK